MSPFHGWYLPPSFHVQEGEIAVLDEGKGGAERPATDYLALPEPRLRELAATLRRERAETLVTFPVKRIVGAVDRVARRFLDGKNEIRGQALEALGAFAGYSLPMAEAVLDGMAMGWLGDRWWDLLGAEFPDPGVLDGFAPGWKGSGTRALGFPLTFHLGAGTVPGVSTTSLIRALLVKSAVLLKPGLGDLPLPVLFARCLQEEDQEVARNLAVVYWPGDESGRTETALAAGDLVVSYSSDETVRWIRGRLPPHIPLRAYRHRMGVGLIGRDALGAEGGSAKAIAEKAARAIALFDQRGCVSPQAFFVERGGGMAPDDWSELLAQALEDLESALPSGPIGLEGQVAIQHLRGVLEMGEGQGQGRVLHGGKRGPWTVAYLPGGSLEPSCLHRTVRVLPVDSWSDALTALARWSPYLQTVGVEGFEVGAEEIWEAMARLGVSRISDLEQVPWPKSWWHHDGSGPLQDLVRWTEMDGVGDLNSDSA